VQAMMTIGQSVLERYEVVDLIAEGGQATVAKGRDPETGRFVAIKRLNASPNERYFKQKLDRFRRAGSLRVNHPAVVDPIACGEEDGRWSMIMPFIDGVDLEQYATQQGGRLPPEEAARIVTDTADGLQAIHDYGVVHRDVKPGNILIDPQGKVHIIDLGVCRLPSQATMTGKDDLVGTLVWMSPEQIRQPDAVGYASDWYSLGAVFYCLLTGTPPVQGANTESIVLSICQQTPPAPATLVSGIPPHLSVACMRLLAKGPAGRYEDADALRRALQTGAPGGATITCPACHFPGAKGSYCNGCGAALRPSPSSPRCLACGLEAGSNAVCPTCGRPFDPAHRLEFVKGPLAGQVFRMPQGVYVMGRKELCERDQHISRRQLEVACHDGSCTLEDAGSTNQTLVDGRPIQGPTPLTHGQTICIAGNSAIYRSH